MTEQTCSRCDGKLQRPHPENANYVRSSDFAEPQPVDVHYGLYHTEETRNRAEEMAQLLGRNVEDVSAEMANPDAPSHVRVPDARPTYADTDEDDHGVTLVEFSVPTDDFNVHVVDSPVEFRNDPDLAYVTTVTERHDVPKTALLCPDCTVDDDEIIWGVDA